jgi:hypothetical protein
MKRISQSRENGQIAIMNITGMYVLVGIGLDTFAGKEIFLHDVIV